MIEITLTPQPKTRTAERDCFWTASAIVDCQQHEAHSRSGAVFALCRVLRDASLPDCAITVTQKGLSGKRVYPSFHEQAKWTMSDGRTRGPIKVRWIDLKAEFST